MPEPLAIATRRMTDSAACNAAATSSSSSSASPSDAGRVLPWVLAGKSEGALRGQAQRLLEFVRKDPRLDPADIGLSLTNRSAFAHRAAVVGNGREALLDGLQALIEDEPAAGVAVGTADAQRRGVVFLFPGQGSQWEGMGSELYRTFPVFTHALDEVCTELDVHLEVSLRDVLLTEAGANAGLLELGQCSNLGRPLRLGGRAVQAVLAAGSYTPISCSAIRSASWPPPTWRGLLAQGCLRAGRRARTADGTPARPAGRWCRCRPPRRRCGRGWPGWRIVWRSRRSNGPFLGCALRR